MPFLFFRLVLSLNASCLLYCSLVMPFTLTTALLPLVANHHAYEWPFSGFWCRLVAFAGVVTTSSTAPTIAFIAMDR